MQVERGDDRCIFFSEDTACLKRKTKKKKKKQHAMTVVPENNTFFPKNLKVLARYDESQKQFHTKEGKKISTRSKTILPFFFSKIAISDFLHFQHVENGNTSLCCSQALKNAVFQQPARR